VRIENIKPQYDRYYLPGGQEHLPAGRRPPGEPGLRHRPSELRDVELVHQPDLAQIDLWQNKDKYEKTVYRLPKKLDEEVARLHLEKIGVKLTKLTKKQADYLGVPVEGPEHYKPEPHYRIVTEVVRLRARPSVHPGTVLYRRPERGALCLGRWTGLGSQPDFSVGLDRLRA
jgi:hypothetical protein